MRAAFLLLLAPLVASAVETRLTDPTARYSAMLDESPFALATVVEAPKEPTESFAANWELIGLARFRGENGQETDYVTIRGRDKRLTFTLIGDKEATEEEAKGVSIHSVDRQEMTRKSTVTLKKAGEPPAKVEFSQDATPPPAPPPVNAAGMNPNQSRVIQQQQVQAQQARVQQMQNQLTYGGNKPPAGQPAANIPRPPSNGVIQPNGVNTALPNGNPQNGIIYPQPNNGNINPAAPNSADPRRRLRVINTRQ